MKTLKFLHLVLQRGRKIVLPAPLFCLGTIVHPPLSKIKAKKISLHNRLLSWKKMSLPGGLVPVATHGHYPSVYIKIHDNCATHLLWLS
jgi:hypothetical protein